MNYIPSQSNAQYDRCEHGTWHQDCTQHSAVKAAREIMTDYMVERYHDWYDLARQIETHSMAIKSALAVMLDTSKTDEEYMSAVARYNRSTKLLQEAASSL